MHHEYLDPTEQQKLQALQVANPFAKDTLRALDLITGSRVFKRLRPEAKNFLGFVVAKRLLGCTDEIKEATIAVHVYHEPADYNPVERTKVRVAAANLRDKIAFYYADEGRDDAIQIDIPKGSYVPEIRDRRILIAVSPFENWNPTGDQDYLCRTLDDDVVHRLSAVPRVLARSIPATARTGDRIGYRLRGSLELRGNTLRINVSLSDLVRATVIWDHALEGERDDLLKLSEQLTHALVGVFESQPALSSPLLHRERRVDLLPRRPPSRSLSGKRAQATKV